MLYECFSNHIYIGRVFLDERPQVNEVIIVKEDEYIIDSVGEMTKTLEISFYK